MSVLWGQTCIAIPPGETIKEMLVSRGMTQKEFAARMGMSEKHISRLINGDVQLTYDAAVRLETVLGAPPRFWIGLEAGYREALIKAKSENTMDADMRIAAQFPYNEMAKYGWVPSTRSAKERTVNLRKYFEVVELSFLGNAQLTRIACRRLAITEKGDLALMAWAQRAKLEARKIDTGAISIGSLAAKAAKLKILSDTGVSDSNRELKAALADLGVALVFLPHLRGSFLQGATFTDGNKIVIGLDEREKTNHKLQFNLFHEIAHIVLGHINRASEITEQDEKDADLWAREILAA